METRASHVLVGLFVVVLTVAAAAFALWLARAQLDRRVDVYDIVFRTSVAGLQTGAQVTYQGIQVGRVARIRFDPEDVERVLVRVEVEPSTPVTDDTVGRLLPQGITGLFNVQLSGGSNESEPLPSRPGNPVQIPGAPSTFDRLTADAPELLNRGVVLLERATRLLDESNLDAIAETLANLETVSASVAGRSQSLEAAIDDSAALVAELRAAAGTLQTTLARLDNVATVVERDVDGLLQAGTDGMAAFADASDEMQRAAVQLDGILRDVRPPMRDFAQGGLYEFDALIGETRQLVAAATRITREFERDPAGFLLGGSFKGFQAD